MQMSTFNFREYFLPINLKHDITSNVHKDHWRWDLKIHNSIIFKKWEINKKKLRCDPSYCVFKEQCQFINDVAVGMQFIGI